MITSRTSEFLAGAVFGSALAASGVYSPPVIIGQMQWESSHMLQVFLSASATSALVFSIAQWSRVAMRKLRAESTLGYFPFDGNVIGGAITGAGMAIGGACPGTAFVQTALGTRSGPQVLFGGVLGALAFLTAKSMARSIPRTTRSPPASQESESNSASQVCGDSPATISSLLGISESTVLVLWEAMCVVALFVAMKMPSSTNSPALVDPLTGGLLIGLSQVVNIGLSKHPIGVSSAYEDFARWLQKLGTSKVTGNTLSELITPSIAFATGIMAGAFVMLWTRVLSLDSVVEHSMAPGRAVLSGALIVFGSRVAGGCTSGHGISGMSAFSVSSIVTTGAIFGSGILTARLMG